jgi:hypothetical protein
VRFGYDPRADPHAKMYQTLDFRLRQSECCHSYSYRALDVCGCALDTTPGRTPTPRCIKPWTSDSDRVSVAIVIGPWRCLWVRFGYYPCADPHAKMYQTLDFRLRQSM